MTTSHRYHSETATDLIITDLIAQTHSTLATHRMHSNIDRHLP